MVCREGRGVNEPVDVVFIELLLHEFAILGAIVNFDAFCG